jgi:hypothetical protein
VNPEPVINPSACLKDTRLYFTSFWLISNDRIHLSKRNVYQVTVLDFVCHRNAHQEDRHTSSADQKDTKAETNARNTITPRQAVHCGESHSFHQCVVFE